MRQSHLATKTRWETPTDETSPNAQLLLRAGYVHKNMAGVYSFLPLGLRSIEKIVHIIREEMNSIGGQELTLNTLQNPAVWKQSGRWEGEGVDEVWFRTNLAVGGETGLGWTHEEVIAELMTHHIRSYKDLPVYLYQFQTKFRNEKRAKSGIMRTREFMMKDLYSFCTDEEQHKAFYESCAEAYDRIFKRIGIGDDTYRTFASGGAFSEFSDEFQTITPNGEDIIYVNKEKNIALNQEVYRDDVLERLGLTKGELEEHKASEVGNIFTLATRFSEPMHLAYTAKDGKNHNVFMGSYGIGPARLLGVIAEKYAKEDKLLLPAAVAPYTVHIVALGKDEAVRQEAEELYNALQSRGIDVLFDDRDASPGEKFSDSDLLGIPHRMVISSKTLAAKSVEHKDRMNSKEQMVPNTTEALLQAIQ